MCRKFRKMTAIIINAFYFFTDGFGIYTELNTPFAKYNTDDLTPAEELHNQFTITIGASFNLYLIGNIKLKSLFSEKAFFI